MQPASCTLGDVELPELREGSRVALLVPGSTAYVELVLALLGVGIFPVPLDPALSASERERILASIEPDLVLTDTSDIPALAQTLAAHGGDAFPRGRPIHTTSGTTGTPKGVFSGLLPTDQADALVHEERDLWGFCPDDLNLVLSPLHHSAPLRFAMGTLLAGGRLTVPGGFDAARITAVIETQRPTTMFCVPTHLKRLFAHWDEVGMPDLSCFRLVAHAGAPCPSELKRQALEAFPAGSTWEFYGSTEGQFTACRSEEWLERPGTVGRARPGRRLSVDPDGQLWCAVPPHARFSYLGDPEKTASAWRETTEGPTFTVGDVGRIDADGYVFLDGRRHDLVITGGVNVHPLEVENALRSVPGVEDVAVFAMPDPEWGQRVCAAVVGGADEPSLRAHASAVLAPPKRPKDYVWVAGLPLTSTGKVRRDELPQLFASTTTRSPIRTSKVHDLGGLTTTPEPVSSSDL